MNPPPPQFDCQRHHVDHVKLKQKWKFRVITKCSYTLRTLTLTRSFSHCCTKNNQVTNQPIFSGDGRVLTFHVGYSWDGASGLAIDTRNTRCASLVHDGLYQAMRLGLLPRDMKALADEEMLLILEEDGMSGARRWFWKLGLKVPCFSAKATKPISGQVYAPCP